MVNDNPVKPLVSVLMTAYNRENYIAEAIQSVLSSSYTNFELIIVDDRSSDRTVEIARSFEKMDNRIRVYINEQNLGDYPNRNKAASYAIGKYIKYVDADDLLYEFSLEILVTYMERFPEAGFALGSINDDFKPFPILLKAREIYLEHFSRAAHFDRAPGSGFIKLEAFNEVGGFSGKRMIGDYEFWFKISRKYSMVKVSMDLYWNRLHADQESQTEYAKKNYKKLRREILMKELKHKDCPLTIEDYILIKKFIRNQQLRKFFEESLNRIKKYLK